MKPAETDSSKADRFVNLLRIKVRNENIRMSDAMDQALEVVYGPRVQVIDFWWTTTPDGLYRPVRKPPKVKETKKPATAEERGLL